MNWRQPKKNERPDSTGSTFIQRPVKVLHCVPGGEIGGVQSFVLDLARQMDRTQFEISACVLGSDGPIVELLRKQDVPCTILGPATDVFGRLKAFEYFARNGRRFDVLHTSVGGRRFRQLSRIAGTRVIVAHVHGPDLWRHVGNPSESSEVKRAVWNFYARGSDRLIGCSSTIGATLQQMFPSFRNSVDVVRCGVDLERFRPKPQAGARHDVVVGFVGRLDAQKHVADLLRAARIVRARMKNVRFSIVGDGPERADLERYSAALGLSECCTFEGSTLDVPGILPTFDMVVLPSAWEGLPIVCLEAMATAKPVVAYEVGSMNEAVEHGRTGLLVAPNQPDALAEAIVQLASDQELRSRFGTAGRTRVERLFDAKRTATDIQGIYLSALKSREPGTG